MNKRRSLQALLAIAATPWTLRATAQEFPIAGKPIRIVVGFPAGGGTDLQAREFGQHLSETLHVPVLIDDRPGAGTMLAALEVAHAAPDGHTLLYTPSTTMAQLPHTLAAVRYDPFRDFTPISLGALGPLVLVVHKSVPANNVQELVAYAKAHPGQLNFVSQGIGTSAHIYGEMFAREAGVSLVHVPYKGANDASKDFLAGRVHLQFASSSAAVALDKTGQVRMLAVVAMKRSDLFPDLQTLTEQGIPGLDIESWVGFFGPAGMPAPVIARLDAAIAEAVKSQKLQQDFRLGGVEAKASSPAQFAGIVKESYEAWGAVVKRIGLAKM